MNTLTEGKLKEARTRQMKELETMAANPDGTCGKRVHAQMKGKAFLSPFIRLGGCLSVCNDIVTCKGHIYID